MLDPADTPSLAAPASLRKTARSGIHPPTDRIQPSPRSQRTAGDHLRRELPAQCPVAPNEHVPPREPHPFDLGVALGDPQGTSEWLSLKRPMGRREPAAPSGVGEVKPAPRHS